MISRFVYPENENAFYPLKFPLVKDLTKLPIAQIYCLEKVILAPEDFAEYPLPMKKYCIVSHFKLIPNPIGFDSTLINFTKLWLMPETELQKIVNIKDKKEFLDKLQNVGADIDDKAINFLKIRFQVVLRSYPTTIEQDENILAEMKLSENARNAILLRLCEKRIIKQNLDLIGQPSVKVG